MKPDMACRKTVYGIGPQGARNPQLNGKENNEYEKY